MLIRKDGHIDEQASMKNIGDFLKMHSAARKDGSGAWIRNPDGTLLQDNYEKHYRDGYQKYKDSKNYHDSQVILRAKHYI